MYYLHAAKWTKTEHVNPTFVHRLKFCCFHIPHDLFNVEDLMPMRQIISDVQYTYPTGDFKLQIMTLTHAVHQPFSIFILKKSVGQLQRPQKSHFHRMDVMSYQQRSKH